MPRTSAALLAVASFVVLCVLLLRGFRGRRTPRSLVLSARSIDAPEDYVSVVAALISLARAPLPLGRCECVERQGRLRLVVRTLDRAFEAELRPGDRVDVEPLLDLLARLFVAYEVRGRMVARDEGGAVRFDWIEE